MKLPDVNIWFALSLTNHELHSRAKTWLETQERDSSIHFCRPTKQGYLRLLTTAAVMKGMGKIVLSNLEAWETFDTILQDPRITFAPEPPDLEEAWKSLALRKTASPKLWMDAYLAAFAIRSGFQLVSADKAFSQFKGLDFHLIEKL
ncbi:MAG: TA system VapC family ribonuclease toxin [Akkermansiaceae bacterium]